MTGLGSNPQVLTPHVYWAQRHRDIYLRVELSDAKDVKAQGHGAKGDHQYKFTLEFLEPVKPEINHKSTQRQVDIKLRKQEERWWDRLTLQEKKPLFLAPDFDRWLDESDAEVELQAKEEQRLNKISIESRHRKDPYVGLKKGYLFMYNLVQFLGFSWIFVNMTVRLFILGQDSFYDTFHTTADMMYFCQMLAVLEVINPLLGLVKTGFFPALIQVAGRNVILFVVFGSLEEMQNKPVVFFVFYLWSTIEIFRYPFYMLACIGTDWPVLTWLRYSLWIPLYPLGVIAEALAVIQSLPIFDESRLFSLSLPAVLGRSMSFSYTLQLYLVLMFLGLFINFRHLYKLRQRRYRSRKRKLH
ncbi:very-long-chain (3R)-3-hydroxyacyl-CoA dehydratase isoform X1 [Nematolebias whitei]|uniref:very-long-chain (3R)-3-hydroxyacyl-CoA dehydratase isoform X1 n=1 Tax=Nematolebias whitei TaxID=451745 RepID=UPI00189AD924|nr:very-long-chain (3R)-3-hydroxyacyl-CoA dehydratase isoform X1 [Nematolebias whitei]